MNKNVFILSVGFALLGSVIFGVYLGLGYVLGINPFGINWKSLDFFIWIACVSAALLYYRWGLNSGKMHYWEALLIGLVLTVVMAAGNYTAVILLGKVLGSEQALLAHHIKEYIQLVEATKAGFVEKYGAAKYDLLIADIKHTTLATLAFQEWKRIPLGVALTVILGALFRN